MSFILDALRKSEAERQRNRAPGIADMRRAEGRKSRSIWLPLAALLAGLNIALLGLLWFNSGNDAPTQAAASAAPASPATTSVSQPATNADPVQERRVTERSADLSEELAPVEMSPAEPARFAAIVPPDATPQPDPVDIEIPPAPVDTLPSVTAAIMNGSLNIKPMNLDLHVYSNTPAERFVFINMNRYSEGDRTGEGPTVKTINEDGVILSYQGRDFLLTRE